MEGFYQLFAGSMRRRLMEADLNLNLLQEIRMRIACPVLLYYGDKEYALTEEGILTDQIMCGYRMEEQELKEILEGLTGYSLYAFQEELKQGFMTVSGGHRIGVAGKIIQENGKITGIRHISFVNIRLAHQVKGCADFVMNYICKNGVLCHTLIVSPPCCGKTTLLRDMIRQISNGTETMKGKTVGVVDERGELAGSYCGIPQNDLGIRTDILEGCSKRDGMQMLLRSMSPHVLAVDELGNSADAEAVEAVFHSGCRLIATVHGSAMEDICRIPLLRKMQQFQLFERYIFLDRVNGAGSVREIFDGEGRVLYQRGE